MAITATALLRISTFAPSPELGLHVEALSDALLLHTEANFASDPAELGMLLRTSLGSALHEHRDPRGVFFLPSVAAPKAQTYDAVLAEVGEGGMWVALPAEDEEDGFALPDGLGALGAVLGSMLQHMPQSLVAAATAAAQGDMESLSHVSDQVAAMLGESAPPTTDLAGLSALLAGGQLDASSPLFQNMLASVQNALERDPEQVARLAMQLFGQETASKDEPE